MRSRTDALAQLPPLVLMGGEANALSVARDMARRGVEVFYLGSKNTCVRFSRHCRAIICDCDDPSKSAEDVRAEYLLGPEAAHLEGAVLLACDDVGIQTLCRHRDALARRYRLDISDCESQASMLDKLTTYQHAQAAGVPTPRFWAVTHLDEVFQLRDELVFPLMIKPRLSHLFERRFGRKHVIVNEFDEVIQVFKSISDAGVEALLTEPIPGGDDQLCSYFSYFDENGEAQFDFTKRVIRRYPTGMGAACYHITDRIPEIVEISRKLCRQAGLRGLANVEYKFDARDGQYKLIECNARFVASNRLVSASGCELARFVYNRIVGLPLPELKEFRVGVRMWDPIRDFAAFRELRREGRITSGQWLRSVMHRQTFPYFLLTDPMPTFSRLLKPIRAALSRNRASDESESFMPGK